MKYLFVLIFLIQNSAWATNAYSVKAMVDLRPVEDQRYFEETLGDVGKVNLPPLTFHQGEVSFNFRGKKFTGKARDEYKLMMNGKELDFGPGKLFKAHEELEKNWKVGGAAAAIALSLTHAHYVAHTLNRTCEELQLSDSLTSQEVQVARKDLDKNRLCMEGNDQWPVIVKACKEMKVCIAGLEEKIGLNSRAVNNSGRESLKEVNDGKRAPSSTLKRTSNQ